MATTHDAPTGPDRPRPGQLRPRRIDELPARAPQEPRPEPGRVRAHRAVGAAHGPVRARLRPRVPRLGVAQPGGSRGGELRRDEPDCLDAARTTSPSRRSTAASSRPRPRASTARSITVPAPTFSGGTSIGAPATVDAHLPVPPDHAVHRHAPRQPDPGDRRRQRSRSAPARSRASRSRPTCPRPRPLPRPTAGTDADRGPRRRPRRPTPTAGPTAHRHRRPRRPRRPPPGQCTVIQLVNVQSNKATGNWHTAGFTGSVIFSPLVPPNYKIAWQSLTVGTSQLCTANITVRSTVAVIRPRRARDRPALARPEPRRVRARLPDHHPAGRRASWRSGGPSSPTTRSPTRPARLPASPRSTSSPT